MLLFLLFALVSAHGATEHKCRGGGLSLDDVYKVLHRFNNEFTDKLKEEAQKREKDIKANAAELERRLSIKDNEVKSLLEEVAKSKVDIAQLTAKLNLQTSTAKNNEKEIGINKKQLESLRTKVSADSSKVTILITRLTSTEGQMKTSKQKIGSLENGVSAGKRERVEMNTKITAAGRKIEVGKWPQGSYCIFRSGNCPSGFRALYGRIGGISVFRDNSNYVTAAKFGSSEIRCHGTCGQYNRADMSLAVCCK